MIRALLFDLDRTLIDRDTSIARFFARQASRYGHHLRNEADRDAFLTRALVLDNRGMSDKGATYRQIVDEFALPAEAARQMEEEFRSEFAGAATTFPDTQAVLARLHSRGYRMGIVTNGSVRVQQAKISGTGLSVYMRTVVISEAEGIKKPDPEIFRRALERVGAQASETVFVGDNLTVDVDGSRNAGLIPLWFAADASAGASATASVKSLTELERWLDARSAPAP